MTSLVGGGEGERSKIIWSKVGFVNFIAKISGKCRQRAVSKSPEILRTSYKCGTSLAERAVQLYAGPFPRCKVSGADVAEGARLGAGGRARHDHALAQLQGAAGVRGL